MWRHGNGIEVIWLYDGTLIVSLSERIHLQQWVVISLIMGRESAVEMRILFSYGIKQIMRLN